MTEDQSVRVGQTAQAAQGPGAQATQTRGYQAPGRPGADRFRELLRLLTRRLGYVERDCFSCCGVTLTQCHLVGEVARSGPQTLGRLAQTLELDPGSASRAVEAMVKQGYLERVPDPQDRRYVTISLTRAGAALSTDVERTGVTMAERVLLLIPPSEHALVFEALTLLNQALASMDTDAEGCCQSAPVAPSCCQAAASNSCCEASSTVSGCCEASTASSAGRGEPPDMKQAVRRHYAGAAQAVLEKKTLGYCDSAFGQGHYDAAQIRDLPVDALEASLGCGNPTILAKLNPGEVVLDLGSGGGIDVLLSARRVGPTGHAYGVDMTDEMLELACRNQAESGLANVTFLKGEIEDLPLPDGAVDVVISNCVLNLSVDKDRVFKEIYRVLRPGGRMAVSDMVFTRPAPEALRKSAALWSSCVAGALTVEDYRAKMEAAGFTDVSLEITREIGLGLATVASASVKGWKRA